MERKKTNISDPHLLQFPVMHEQLLTSPLPTGVFLLDPGVDQADSPAWRPENLPLTRKEASRYLDEMMHFGNRFRDPQEMRFFSAAEVDDFYSRTSLAIRSQLTEDKREAEKKEFRQMLIHAQSMLLLNWWLEERHVELKTLQAEMGGFSDRFESILGVEGKVLSKGIGQSHEAEWPDPMDQDMGRTWDRLLQAFLLFLPPDCCLHVSEPAILEWLREKGIVFTDVTAEDHPRCLENIALDSARLATLDPKSFFSNPGTARKGWMAREYVFVCFES